MTTRNSLGIFWMFSGGHEEVEGISLFGLWSSCLPNSFNIDEITKFWTGWEFNTKVNEYNLEEYKVIGIDFYIKSFPDSNQWIQDIEAILKWITENGAIISWCGGEDCSPNPEILKPGNAVGNIYACYSPSIGFVCNSGLEEEMEYLNDDQLKDINNSIRS